MVSLQDMVLEFGENAEGVKEYFQQSKENKGIYYLGGQLPIHINDRFKKKVIEDVKNMMDRDSYVFKEFRKKYFSIYSMI